MGLLSGIGSVVTGIGSLLGLRAQKKAADAQIQSNQDNLAFQRENLEYQKGIDQFNMDMANKQFNAQMALNERNSITGQTAEMARNGLNPLTGSNFANGSGAVSGSQISSGAQAIVAPNDFSAMSQLGAQMTQMASSGFDRRNAERMNKAGLQNAQILATLTDKNEIAKLAMECIENGIDPEFLKNVISSTPGATAGFKEVSLNDFNKTRLIHEARKSHAETKIAEAEADMSDPATLLESLGIDSSDNNRAIRAMIGLLRIVRGNR